MKNHLVLLPSGSWDGDVTKRFELPMKKRQVVVTLRPKEAKKDGEPKAKSPVSGEKKKVKKKVVAGSGASSPSKTKVSGDDAKASGSSESSPEKSPKAGSKIGTPKTSSVEVPVAKSAPEEAPQATSTLTPEASPKAATKKSLKLSPDAPSPAKPSSPIKEIDCEPIDQLPTIGVSEQLQQLPQSRNLISPVDNPLSDLCVSDVEQLSDDDLALGASASPTMMCPSYDFGGPTNDMDGEGAIGEGDQTTSGPDDGQDPMLSNFYRRKYGGDELPSWKRIETTAADFVTSATTEAETGLGKTNGGPRGYVGLVNQAMTCYLNSLLQALYMTPEFRNALYRWEFDNDNEAKNIPYQLQKLFLNLQTSPKAAVETTDLTRSFGWDSTEAWQQHDIQELCRVMFDALEHKFKNTKQSNLISNLYEGKMNDYVKCLECNTEKSREDTFLDIPLPVRPFGSSSAYGSIEEALRAFVQPETLDGNNQYLCEKCKKKCDAHKGLHFKSFPYILTLHLKRFDFDYQTMHRIKLNDRWVSRWIFRDLS